MMNLQYISDSSGKTTGVFIPIAEWNELKSKYKGIEEEPLLIPDWQQEEVRSRLEAYKADPSQIEDFDTAIDEIETAL